MVEDSDAGKYQCELVKSGNTTACHVTVEDSPFNSDPVSKSIFVGESAEFEVLVKDESSNVNWTVNGKSDDSRFEKLASSGLSRRFKVTDATLEDMGELCAIVEGRETKPVSCQFNVYEHLVVTKAPENWDGKEKDEVYLNIEVNKEAKVTWYNNRKAISADDHYSIASEGCVHTLRFKATKEDDGATIEATFGAELEEYVSTSANLSVLCGSMPAKLDLGEEDREIVLGEKAEIPFDLRGKPEPEISVTIRELNKEMTCIASPTVKIQRLITIENVCREDAGTYVINAKNEEGNDSGMLHVRVIAKPKAPEGITVTKMTNDACGFCWRAPAEVDGLSILKYSIGWRLAEAEEWTIVETKDETSSYFLQGLKKDSAIELKVAGHNRAGMGAWSDVVGPHVVSDGVFAPGFPVEVKVEKSGVKKDAVPITWEKPASDGGAPISGYQIEKQVDGADSWEPCGESTEENFTVTPPSVAEGKAYRFRVKAVNEAGASGGSEPTDMVVVEDPNLKPQAPANVTADNPSNNSIDVSWKVPASEQPITGYVIEKLKQGGDAWQKCAGAPGDQQAVTVVDLEEDVTYTFRVFAENESGMSQPSEMSNPCTTVHGAGKTI